MDNRAMVPYGQALLNYYHGDVSATIVVHREDGLVSDIPASIFFREPSTFSPIEQKALDLCRGQVLDIGAGTGCHSLSLQDRGMPVLAIDVSSQAVEIMSHRDVKEYQQADVFEFLAGPFDTLLVMMHGIGMVQDLSGLDRFLNHTRRLVKPDGQMLLDSLDVHCTDDPRHLSYLEANRQAGRYEGEIRMRFGYKGRMGPQFGWLHVDPETLDQHAEGAGWSSQVVCQEDSGDYLAQLKPLRPGL